MFGVEGVITCRLMGLSVGVRLAGFYDSNFLGFCMN